MMIQKKHYGIGYDDYLLGAIMLYADFINLFLLPISLCLKRR
jgi:FtsH-binding integral membrane protein